MTNKITTEESEQYARWLIENGHAIPSGDGIYRLSDQFEKYLRAMINAHPELYAKLFPDRVQ